MAPQGNWKQAINNTTEHGYACYDMSPATGDGHFTLVKQDDIYDVEGRIGGVSISARSSDENGLQRALEELNIDPTSGWYSL